MAFLPVGSNRVPTSLDTLLSLDNLRTRQQALTRATIEVSTGRRINLPSDDPAGSSQVEFLHVLRERKGQFLGNVRAGEAALNSVVEGLRQLSDTVDQANSSALQALNQPTSDPERSAFAVQYGEMVDGLIRVANQQFLRRFSYAGQQSDTTPFERDGTFVVFNGDNRALESLDGLDVFFPINVTANASFGSDSSAGRSDDLDPALLATTRLQDLNGGAGVDRGVILIDDGVATVEVDLSNADSIQDVIDIVNDAAATAGLGVTAALNAAGNGLAITSAVGATLGISDLGGGTTARDLGIRVTGFAAAPPFTFDGGDVDPAVTQTTPLGALRGGTLGASFPLGDIQIDNGPHSATITLADPNATVEDLLNEINSAGVRVRAEINNDQTGINVLNVLSGSGYTITGTGAQALGISTTTLDTQLADFNDGGGVIQPEGNTIEITTPGGVLFQTDLTGATTVRDVKTRIEQDSVTAGMAPGDLVVGIDPSGGITLTDNSAAGTFFVTDIQNSTAASNLGIATGTAGTPGPLVAPNQHRARVDGIFDTLLRLRNALETNDDRELNIAARQLEADRDRALGASGTLGSRLQALQTTGDRIENELLEIEKNTTLVLDADLTESITNLLAQQNALQAALASTSRLLQGSLLDFI